MEYCGILEGPVDHLGNQVKNTKHDSPYSYDPYVIMGVPGAKYKHADYSDRLRQWDSDKYQKLVERHFKKGQRFDNTTIDIIEKFLKDYHDDPGLKLVMVAEGANQATGYPYWIFFYNNGVEG